MKKEEETFTASEVREALSVITCATLGIGTKEDLCDMVDKLPLTLKKMILANLMAGMCMDGHVAEVMSMLNSMK